MTALPKLAKDRRLNVIEDLWLPIDKEFPKSAMRRLQSYYAAMLHDARTARRFILGDEASFQVGRWIDACEDILLDNLQFAKPPFERCYVEMSVGELHRGLGRPISGPQETADDRLGFLIIGNHVRVVVSGPVEKGAQMGAWDYWLNTPDDDPVIVQGHNDRNEWTRLKLILGSTMHALKDEHQRLAICYGTRVRTYIPDFMREVREWDPTNSTIQTKMLNVVAGSAGELRNLWAVLLLINQHRRHLSFQDMPRQVALTPRRRVYQAHTLVTLPIHPPEAVRRTYYPNTRASPVGHEVRGHWVRFHLEPGCVHEWPMIPDDHGHFVCERCRGWRTWKKAYHRGNAVAGYDVHTYEVTP